jgi:pyruvate formate lyase activating enzyme
MKLGKKSIIATCKKCNKVSEDITKVLQLCAECIRDANSKCLTELKKIHAAEKFGLLGLAPSASEGAQCRLCQNSCQVPIGERGYCGVRRNENGHLKGGTPKEAAVS